MRKIGLRISVLSFALVSLITTPLFAAKNPYKGCKRKLTREANPLKRALWLTPEERDQLPARALRFFEPVRILNNVLESHDPNPDTGAIADRVRRTDARIQAFELDGAFRATIDAVEFEGSKYKRLLKGALDRASQLRFQTGVFTDSQDIESDLAAIRLHEAEQGRELQLSETFLKIAQKKVKKGKKNYIEFLEENDWVGRKPKSLKLMEDAAKVLSTLSEKEDLIIIKNYILEYVREIETTNFDMKDLEKGIHPLRRHLRWVAIMIQALNLFQVYDPAHPPAVPGNPFLPSVNGVIPQNVLDASAQKYANIKTFGVLDAPIYIHKNVYEYLTYMIFNLGNCKTIGQRIERFAEIFLEAKEAKTPEEAYAKAEKLASLHPLYFDFRDRAQKIYDVLVESGLLEEIRDEVLRGINARLVVLNGGPH